MCYWSINTQKPNLNCTITVLLFSNSESDGCIRACEYIISTLSSKSTSNPPQAAENNNLTHGHQLAASLVSYFLRIISPLSCRQDPKLHFTSLYKGPAQGPDLLTLSAGSQSFSYSLATGSVALTDTDYKSGKSFFSGEHSHARH